MNRNNNNMPATFKAGDAVLCPSIGNSSYTLYPNGSDKDSTRLIIRSDDDSHGFYRDGRVFPNDALPSLFHDTEANRQAIATLYNGRFTTHTSQRTVIDTTEADDNIVITMSSHDLSHIASDIYGAANALNDVGYLLGLVYYGKIEGEAVKSMTRLAHDATNTWEDILRTQLDIINKPLAMTGYSKVGAE
jgi:hypothetical protein